jgi:hypothetical protein
VLGWDFEPQSHSRASNINFDISIGNTFDLNPKEEWERTFPFFGNFSWDSYRLPRPLNPNIKADI